MQGGYWEKSYGMSALLQSYSKNLLLFTDFSITLTQTNSSPR